MTTTLTRFGSEVYVAAKLGRRGVGIELKPSYWRTAVDNLRGVDRGRLQTSLDGLDDFMDAEEALS